MIIAAVAAASSILKTLVPGAGCAAPSQAAVRRDILVSRLVDLNDGQGNRDARLRATLT
jgi:hypothetical protein